jgi:RNA polymerase sigma-70 factor (ECF subfamily)
LKLENQQISSTASSVELIARAQRGEEEAFEALFHQHKKRVYCLCLRVLGNPAEAEELTQDAFLQLFRKIHTFRGQSAFSTWLHRLSLNLALMRLRKKTISVTSLDGGAGEDEFDEPRSELGAPDAALTGSLERMHLERAIAQLPPGYRQAFLLHDVQGYQHNEIAAMLGMSVGNSKSQLHKARIALRKLLLETGNDRRGRKELQLQPV